MNTRSLSFRLVAWYAGLLTVVFLLLGVLTFLFLRHYLEANLLDTQARRAGQIADTLLVAAGRTSALVWVIKANPSRFFYQRMGGKFVLTRRIRVGGELVDAIAYGWPDLAAYSVPR